MRVEITGYCSNIGELKDSLNQILENLEADKKKIIDIKYAISSYATSFNEKEAHYALVLYEERE